MGSARSISRLATVGCQPFPGGDKYLSRAVDAGTLSNKLQSLWDRGRFPTKLSREPSTTGLRSFDAGLHARAPGDTLVSTAFVDEAKGRVLVKVAQSERLPKEGATSSNTTWYAVPLQQLRD